MNRDTLSPFNWQQDPRPSVFATDPHFTPKHNAGWSNLKSGARALDQRGRLVVDMAKKTTGSISIEPSGGGQKRRRLAHGRAI